MTLPQALRSHLEISSDAIHLNNAGLAPMTRSAREAIARMATHQCQKAAAYDFEPYVEEYLLAKKKFAQFLNIHEQGLAATQTCAIAISQVAFGLPLKPGDEILTWEGEYPSNAYPWHSAAQRSGAKVVAVSPEKNYQLRTEKMCDAVNERTRIIAVSWVQYLTGAMSHLQALVDAKKSERTWVVVDAIQGLGVIPFDFQQSGIDAVCFGTHKWLLGPMGQGFLGLAHHRVEELTPIYEGALSYGTWMDSFRPDQPLKRDGGRFEPGAPLVYGVHGAAASLDVLTEIGIKKIHEEALKTAQFARERLLEAGHEVLSIQDEQNQSPIVTFVPKTPIETVKERFAKRKVSYAPRAGGIRLGIHAFNTTDEIEEILSLL